MSRCIAWLLNNALTDMGKQPNLLLNGSFRISSQIGWIGEMFLHTIAIAHLSPFDPIFLTQSTDSVIDSVRGIPVSFQIKVVERFCSRATSIRSKNLAPPNVVDGNTERLTPKLYVQSGG